MSSVQPQRELINEQVTPAEETFTEVKEISVKSEEEMDDQRRLLDFTRIPMIILHRIEMDDQRRLLDFSRIPMIILHRIAVAVFLFHHILKISNTDLRRQWEVSIRAGFVATECCKLSSEHFKPEDRTGQIVRLRDDVTSSVFSFPSCLQRDHSYALQGSPTHLKARLREALGRVESLQQEKLNSKARERRAEKSIHLLEDLKKKNLINKKLKERLDFHSDFR
ncbi:LOW QUALITY PROTEIN: uncharacterized protein FYW61_018980 [Anableps anableps]